ncbi:MAG: hypothetical protein ACK559_08715, partial [bacterium]
ERKCRFPGAHPRRRAPGRIRVCCVEEHRGKASRQREAGCNREEEVVTGGCRSKARRPSNHQRPQLNVTVSTSASDCDAAFGGAAVPLTIHFR